MLSSLFSLFPLSLTVWLVQMVAYHGFGLWFEYLDRTGGLADFKMRPPDRWTYSRALPRVLANQVLLLLPAMLMVEALGLAFVGPSGIGPLAFVLGLIGMTIGHDLVQYVSHRFLLHRVELMRPLGHAIHHSTSASRAITACVMSPADFVLEIVFPYLLPLIAVTAMGSAGSSPLFHCFAVAAGAFGGLYEHSGYDFSVKLAKSRHAALRLLAPLITSRAHAEHHARGNVSFSDGFGSSNIADTVLGTRWDLAAARKERKDDITAS